MHGGGVLCTLPLAAPTPSSKSAFHFWKPGASITPNLSPISTSIVFLEQKIFNKSSILDELGKGWTPICGASSLLGILRKWLNLIIGYFYMGYIVASTCLSFIFLHFNKITLIFLGCYPSSTLSLFTPSTNTSWAPPISMVLLQMLGIWWWAGQTRCLPQWSPHVHRGSMQ